jgi:hypothetical protein
VRLALGGDLGHAQYRAARVECDAPAEHGAIAVPQDMVDRLADLDLWGCGDCYGQSVRRYTRARGTAGDVDLSLWVSRSVAFYLQPWPD